MRNFFNLLLLMLVWAQPALVIGREDTTQLAQDEVWLKLLHMQGAMQQSKVTSSNFFLAQDGASDAHAELLATLKILQALPSERLQGMCKFPARFFWLSYKLKQPEIRQALQRCTKLQHWVADNDEISLILVSGYLGNPASTFGHTLLKLQSSQQSKTTMLLDTAINYGALTPKHEPPLTYIYKGMTGGYKATFQDKYYYTQELMYSRLESRDMWAYTLNLDPYQTKLLMYHLWELLGQTFDYYFLDENCAYRLAEVLGVVIDEPMVKDSMWYVPVEAAYRLEQLDKIYRAKGEHGLIKSVTFLPSSQRKLNEQLMRLNRDERQAMKRLMDVDEHEPLLKVLQGLPKASQSKVLDAALSYYNYQYVKSGLKPSPRDKQIKQDILIARFRLPASETSFHYTTQSSPTQGFAPMLIGMGWGYNTYQGGHALLHWAAYHQSTTGKNNLNGDELVVLDTQLGLAGKQDRIFLHHLDFIRVRKLNHNQMWVRNHDWAWQVRAGVTRQDNRYDGIVSFGIGKTWSINANQALYVMADAGLHTLYPHVSLRPHIGWYANWGNMKSLCYWGVQNTGKTKDVRQVWGVEVQYHVENKAAVVFRYAEETSVDASLAYRWFW